ncbi:MAG: M48 family peptidase, partial [Betaproteobacteria bacterium]|nr:M48 family peptidase [Betaproteobacteria bacterium]
MVLRAAVLSLFVGLGCGAHGLPSQAEPLNRSAPSALPALGDPASESLSPATERKLGESVMRDIRYGDPAFVDDPEVNEYLNTLGYKLVTAIPGARLDFEFFAVRDPSINAFALPGGFVGVHTGLLTSADSESEVASVLAHEVTHVTQRHI